jgi:hypothetical protein
MKEEGLSDGTCDNRIESVTSLVLTYKLSLLGMAIHNKEVRARRVEGVHGGASRRAHRLQTRIKNKTSGRIGCSVRPPSHQ